VIETVVAAIIVGIVSWRIRAKWRQLSEPYLASSIEDIPKGIDPQDVVWELRARPSGNNVVKAGRLKRREWHLLSGDEHLVLVWRPGKPN
jgi:hypothetical protein